MAILSRRAGECGAWTVGMLFGFIWCSAAAAQERRSEQEVKAAYVMNLSRYAEWPASAFMASDSTAAFNLCLLGQDPFGGMLDRMARGRFMSGHPVRLQRPATSKDARECHLAYIAGDKITEVGPWLLELDGHPVLTVGDGENFLRQGGAIALTRVDETIRFEVNVASVRRAGLILSSRVLAMAYKLHGTP
jgi:hypothetical protein